MPVPKYDQLMNPTLQALHKLGGSGTITEIEEAVADILKLPEKCLNEIHRGNRTKFSYRLAWSRNYLKRYGLLENSARGVWALTLVGQKTKAVDIAKVKRLDKTNRSGVANKSSKRAKGTEHDLGPEPGELWKEQLLRTLKKIPPASFERLCQRILRESGFVQVEVTGRSGDGGIDGVGIVKIGGLLSFQAVFQCKRYSRSVPVGVVRDFRGAMVGRADKGLLLTTGTFTREAKREANRDGAPPIDLLDGSDLTEKLKELRLGISVELVTTESVVINEEWFRDL